MVDEPTEINPWRRRAILHQAMFPLLTAHVWDEGDLEPVLGMTELDQRMIARNLGFTEAEIDVALGAQNGG